VLGGVRFGFGSLVVSERTDQGPVRSDDQCQVGQLGVTSGLLALDKWL
jgi:hypothetical protein